MRGCPVVVMSGVVSFRFLTLPRREGASCVDTAGDGGHDAYRESRRRIAGYSRQDFEELKAESEAILLHIAEVYRSGAPAVSDAAMAAVEAHRLQITERFYDCSHDMQVHLGEGYVQDPRFTATYEAIEPGLTVWVRDAIRANAERATA